LHVLISEILRKRGSVSGLELSAGFLTDLKRVVILFIVRCYHFSTLLYLCVCSVPPLRR